MIDVRTHKPTYGENLVYNLLRGLPKKRFFFHYEPQLISNDGRSSKPDFILASAQYGVVVIEVKDWVKLTGGDQESISTLRSDGTPMIYPNPIRTTEQYAHILVDRFEERVELWEQYKGRPALKFPWQVMVVLPRISQRDIQAFEAKRIWAPRTVIGKEALTSPTHFEQTVANLPWRFKMERPLPIDMLDIVREVIDPSLAVEDREGRVTGTITLFQEKLISERIKRLGTPGQLALPDIDEVDNTPPNVMGLAENAEVRLVRGVAGSGKTLVLLRRVRWLAEQYPQAKQLVMSFNVDIAADLKTRLDLPEEQVEVINFHKLCSRILGKAWQSPINRIGWLRARAAKEIAQLDLPIEFVSDEIAWRRERNFLDDETYLEADRKGRIYRLERDKRELINTIFQRYQSYKAELRVRGQAWFDWEDVAFLAADALVNHPLHGAYDATLIDEAQDFSPSWIRLTKALLKSGGSLFVCDDPSQSIFRSYSWVQKGLSVVGRTVILRVPFRSTREISQAAHSLLEADDNLRQSEERPEPDFTSYELGSGPLPALFACADASGEAQFVTDKVGELIHAGIPAGQIAVLCHEKEQGKLWAHLQAQGVYVSYYEKMKGLEFDAVFVPHLHDAFSSVSDAEAITMARRKIFTAMTRARYRLTLSYQGRLPKALEPLLEHMWCESYSPL